ncbi:MAG: nucleotide exchange factor GrpE [Patescibacteria group bacterium]
MNHKLIRMSDEQQLPVTEPANDQPAADQPDYPDYKEKWLRAMADYQNLKKQQESERQDWLKFAATAVIAQLLPIASNFAAAAKHVPAEQQSAEWVTGLFHIQKQLDDVLKAVGVEPIATVGQLFNPEVHEAVGQRTVEDVVADQVVEEVQTGYTLHGKVLLPAKVIVSQ